MLICSVASYRVSPLQTTRFPSPPKPCQNPRPRASPRHHTPIDEENARRNRELDKVFTDNKRIREKELAEAKAQSLAAGKEPFNLDELAKHIDLTWRVEYAGPVKQVVPRAEKAAHYEPSYYVVCRDIKTLKDLAAYVERARRKCGGRVPILEVVDYRRLKLLNRALAGAARVGV